MALRNPSVIALYTPYPALQQFATGTFTISISGTVGVGSNASFSGAATLSQTASLTRLFINQNPVPVDIFTPYTSSVWLPVPPFGSVGSLATVNIGCSVAGNPSVASIATNSQLAIAGSAISLQLNITNPYAGAMTLTSTVLTVEYFTFVVTPAFTNS